MISIRLNQIGKKFGREWIFRQVDYQINAGDKLVILGGNGSGKSTLLQVISGFVSANEGEIIYTHQGTDENGINIESEQVKDNISLASPYLQLIEDFTAIEMIEHVGFFKSFVQNFSAQQVIDIIELSHAKDKYIKQFSSGMKQRLRLGLAILADTPLLLLDEPVSNLDKNAIEWYKQMINVYTNKRTVIVCSNAIDDEYFFCDKKLVVTDFKK